MRLFRNRPLCLCCAVYIAASVLGFYLNMKGKAIVGAALMIGVICMLIAALCGKLGKGAAITAGVAVIFAISALTVSYVTFEYENNEYEQYYGEVCEVKATVTERRSSDSYYAVLGMKVYELNGKSINIKAILECDYECDLQAGYRIDAVLIGDALSSLYGTGNSLSLLADGYRMMFIDDPTEANADGTPATNITVTDTDVKTLGIRVEQINARMSARLMSSLGNTSGRFASALLLGNKELIPDATQRDFRRSGISHILALSGMHLSILLGILGFLLGKLGVGKTPRLIILCTIAPMYLVLTGCSVSTVRAFIMVTVTYITSLIGGRSDTLTNLSVAGALIVMISPFSVCDAAYWLSLFATLGIVVGSDALSEWFSKLKNYAKERKWFKVIVYIISAIMTGICANVAVMFFMWLYFGELSLMSPVMTLIVTPIVYALIIISLICIVFGSVPAITEPIAMVANALSDILIDLTHSVSLWDHATVSLSYSFAGWLIVAMTVALAVMLVVDLKKKIFLAFPVLASVLLFCIMLSIHNLDKRVSVTYIQESSMGEALVFSSTEGAVICDVSDGSYSHFNRAAASVGDSGNTVTDVVVLTHYHKKHVTSLGRYMNNNIVKQIWLPVPMTSDEYYIMSDILRRAEDSDVLTVLYDSLSGDSLKVFDDCRLKIEREYISRSAQPVVYIELEAHGTSFAYIGESACETTMWSKISNSTQNYECMVFGNHGPNSKYRYSYSLDSKINKRIVFANETVAAYSVPTEEHEKISIVCGPQRLTYKLN